MKFVFKPKVCFLIVETNSRFSYNLRNIYRILFKSSPMGPEWSKLYFDLDTFLSEWKMKMKMRKNENADFSNIRTIQTLWLKVIWVDSPVLSESIDTLLFVRKSFPGKLWRTEETLSNLFVNFKYRAIRGSVTINYIGVYCRVNKLI